MSKDWTRRRFLAVAGVAGAAGLAGRPVLAATGAGALGRSERATLRAFADELIPALDGMPAATEAGAAAYVEALAGGHEELRAQVRGALAALDDAARARHHRPFAGLTSGQRVEVVKAFEDSKPDTFHPVKNLVYEGYYTQAAVQERLRYVFVPAGRSGVPPEPFDASALHRVKDMPPLYRKTR